MGNPNENPSPKGCGGTFLTDTQYPDLCQAKANERVESLIDYTQLCRINKDMDCLREQQQALYYQQRFLETRISDSLRCAEDVREFIRAIHSSGLSLEDSLIDRAIDLRHINYGTSDIPGRQSGHQYINGAGEQDLYQPTPYNLIREFLNLAKPSKEDVVYDLGCGYGRVLLYSALVSDALFKGIELEPVRIKEANRVKERNKIDHLKFTAGNVLEQDYSDGTIFYLFNPFSSQTLEKVGDALQGISEKKPLKIASYGPSVSYFDRCDWLTPRDTHSQIRIYDSSIQK